MSIPRPPDDTTERPPEGPTESPRTVVHESGPINAIISLLQAMSRTRARRAIRNILGAAMIAGVVAPIAYKVTRDDADEIEFPYDGTEFTLEDMTLEDQVAQLYHGSAYDSRSADVIDRTLNHRKLTSSPRLIEFTDWLTDWLKSDKTIGGVHVFRSDARSLDEANRTSIEIMAKSKIPPFVSMDIVGGFTRHLGMTREEAKFYGVPEAFIKMAKDSGNLELPTQEDLGRAFDKLKKKRDVAGQIQFRKNMELYGAAIARMARDIGIVVNFAPVMDMVDDVDGDQFMESNDETYGSSAHTVMVLAFHYIKGFQSADNGSMIAPKHFAGTGKMPSNPHEEEDPGISSMTGNDGTMLPFLDAFRGHLFHDPIHQSYNFDFNFRRLIRDLDYLRELVHNAEKQGGKATKTPHYKKIKKDLAEAEIEFEAICDKYGIDESFITMPPVRGVMVGHAQNFTNPKTPGSLSSEIVAKRLRENLEFRDIAWTDDMSMGVIDFHVTNGDGKKHDKGPEERFVRALASGITIPMILHKTASLDDMVKRIRKAIETKEDFDGDGHPDITSSKIKEKVRQVLEEKVRLGLLEKRTENRPTSCPIKHIKGQECTTAPVTIYKNNAKQYMSQTRAFRRGTTRGK